MRRVQLMGPASAGMLGVCIVGLGLCGPAPAVEQTPKPGGAAAWWDQRKIRFGWGQWSHIYHPHARSALKSEDLMRNLGRVGMTVFAEHAPGCDLDKARLAHKYGVRYFASAYIHTLPEHAKGAPPAVDRRGRQVHNCPLHEPLYEKWFQDAAMEAAKSGLVDGMHMDWEPYPDKSGPRGVQVACFCDSCFGAFKKKRELDDNIPPEGRYNWLVKRGLDLNYFGWLEDETAAMFGRLAAKVRKLKPDFVFSAYGGYDANRIATAADQGGRWRMYGMARGLNSPAAPFFVLDHRHYWDDHTRPWWYSFYEHNRALGLRTIGGTWDNSLFGGRPDSDVSAAQCLYDIAINMDGHWLWFEQDPGPAVYRAWEIANRRIAATERKVGPFLLRGKQDINFVTAVEWSGDPALERCIVQRTYHLGAEHLLHVNNVDTDRPVTVRLRFGRLPADSRWVVRDAIADLVYVPPEGPAAWDAQGLARGLVVSLEQRSELFLKLSPAPRDFRPKPGESIVSAEIKTMPGH